MFHAVRGGLHSLLPFASRSSNVVRLLLFAFASAIVGIASSAAGQQTNPVDRKVTNPMTDTPNVNPLTQDQPIRQRPGVQRGDATETTDTLVVDSATQNVSGPENARVFVYEGNVDARIGTFRLQADKITVYEATNKIIAEGNVVFAAEDVRVYGGREGDRGFACGSSRAGA